jgi:hypothetical protein
VKALVLGTAPFLQRDLESVHWPSFDRVYGCNWLPIRTGIVPDIWCSLHPESMPDWQNTLVAQRKPIPEEVACSTHRRHMLKREAKIDRWIDPRWPELPEEMTMDTGLFAVKTALEDGADLVVVAGIRLDKSGNLSGVSPRGHDYGRFRPTWEWAGARKFEGKVRGVSGAVMHWFGGHNGLYPTAA